MPSLIRLVESRRSGHHLVAGLGRTALLVVGVAILLGGCAARRANARIVDPGGLYSTYRLDRDANAGPALRQAGLSEAEIAVLCERAKESGWPPELAAFDKRMSHPEIMKAYSVERVAEFGPDDARKVILKVPAKANTHQPDGWRPERDIWFVYQSAGVASP